MKKCFAFVLAAMIAMTGLSSIALAAEETLVIQDGVLTEYKGSETDVVIPEGVTAVGAQAFLEATTVKSVSIPATVKAIGEKAFADCINLEEITVPGTVETIAEDSFFGCSSLKKATLEEGVKTVGAAAFCGCLELCEVSLPESLTEIGDMAFADTALKQLHIPAGVTSIGADCFYGSTALTELAVAQKNEKYSGRSGWLCDKTGRTLLQHPASVKILVVPAIATKVSALLNSGVKKIVLPSSVKSVGGLFGYYSKKKSENVTIYTPRNSATHKYLTKKKISKYFNLYTYSEIKSPAGFKVRKTSKALKLTWKKRSGARSYHVWRRAAKGGTYEKIATVSKYSSTYYDKTAKKGVKYYYRVCATQRVAGKTVQGRMSGARSGRR